MLEFSQFFGPAEPRRKTTKRKKRRAPEAAAPEQKAEEEDPAQVRQLLKSWDALRLVARSLERMGVPLSLAALCGAVPELSSEMARSARRLAKVCDGAVRLVDGDDGPLVVFPPLRDATRGAPASEKARRAFLRAALLKAANGGGLDHDDDDDDDDDEEPAAAPPPPLRPKRERHSDDRNFVVRLLKATEWYEDQAAHIERLEARPPTFGGLTAKLRYDLSELARRPLYEHQARAADAALRGRSVALCTGTASGKSLAYNIPTVEFASADPGRCVALYLYPTKALAQDQLQKMRRTFDCAALAHVTVATLDGDVSFGERRDVVESPPSILLTNPDMLHYTILPNGGYRAALLSSLRLVVVDEAHSYVGAFGAHVACVLRRLRRLCPRDLVFFCASATIANPLAHARALLGVEDVVVVDKDTSPRNEKAVVVWNPPLLRSTEAAKEAASSDEAGAKDLVAARVVAPPELKKKKKKGDGPSSKDIVAVAPLEEKKKKETKDARSWRHRLVYDLASDDERAPDEEGLLTVDERARAEKAEESRREVLEAFLEKLPHGDPDGEGAVTFAARRSAIFETARVFATLAKAKVRCICFARTRKLVELVLSYAKDLVDASLEAKICAYRGGYDKAERRRIEEGLFGGSLVGVVATCALELGVDVGDLDATVHLGHPGSIASLWQQAGRAGRRPKSQSAAIVVCWDSPLDQQFARCGSRLLNRPVEAAALDLGSNEAVLRSHLLCAAFERPLDRRADVDLFFQGGESSSSSSSSLTKAASFSFEECVSHLRRRGRLRALEDGTFGAHPTVKKPAKDVDLRLVDPESFQVIDDEADRPMDDVPYSRAFFELYEGAIYLHQAKPFLITKLDLGNFTARAKALPTCNYRTAARDVTDVDPTKTLESWRKDVSTGYVHVRTDVWGYKKLDRRTGAVLSLHTVTLPALEFDTRGTWIDVPKEAVDAVGDLYAAIHAASHAILAVAPLFVLGADVSDVQSEHAHPQQKRTRPARVVVYDARPGGVGVADTIFRRIDAVLTQALDLLEDCPCGARSGCPSCLFSPSCSAYNLRLDKVGAAIILRTILARRRPPREEDDDGAFVVGPDESPRDDDDDDTPRRKVRRASLRRAAKMDGLGPARTMSLDPGWAPLTSFLPPSG